MTRAGRILGTGLLLLLVLQAGTGRALDHLYRDEPLIQATWIGNDWVTLLLVAPLLAGALWRGSVRGRLLAMGIMAFAIYNSAFYLFGARLNAFFPLHVLIVWVALLGLVAEVRSPQALPTIRRGKRTKAAGLYLLAVAVLLTSVWIIFWAGHIFAGRPLAPSTEAFQVVAATDLLLLVPMLAVAGVGLWHDSPWAGLLAPVAALQGAIYLAVLATNSSLFIALGLAEPPAELVIWLPLLLGTSAAAIALLSRIAPSGRTGPPRRDRNG